MHTSAAPSRVGDRRVEGGGDARGAAHRAGVAHGAALPVDLRAVEGVRPELLREGEGDEPAGRADAHP